MTASRAVTIALMGVGLAALGRLLTPEAFGHFAVAMAIFELAQTAVQFGLRQYVIRNEDELPRETVEAAAGLSLMIATAAAAVCLVTAGVFSGWLLPEGAAWALVPLSGVLLIGPFRLGTEAMLQRSLRFGLISVAEVLKAAANIAVAITLALFGYGAIALACGALAAHVTLTAILLTWGGSKNRVRPRIIGARALRRNFTGWGLRLTAVQMLPKAADLAMVSALSAAQGAATLGLFNRASAIHGILNRTLLEGIRPVILPAFSSAMRSGTPPVRIYQLKLDYMAAICWPSFALIALMAEPLVALLLGPQWDEAVPVVRILALMGLALPVTKMSQKLFVALDETSVFLKLQLIQLLVRLPLAVLGALVSLEAFALAYVAGNGVKAVSIAWYLHRRLGPESGMHRRVAGRAAVITLAALAGPAAVVAAGMETVPAILIALPSAGIGWLFGAWITAHPVISEIRGAALDVRRVMPRRTNRL
jgi:O-antigen/teichoic acid export membrane protein